MVALGKRLCAWQTGTVHMLLGQRSQDIFVSAPAVIQSPALFDSLDDILQHFSACKHVGVIANSDHVNA
jgi:hypothetical protein